MSASGHEGKRKNCRYCQVELAVPGAPYCKECSQWQWPFGWLVSQMSLGDVALYASIIAVLLASFGGVLFGKSARLQAAQMSCGSYSVTLFISNDGNNPAILTGVTLRAVEGSNTGNELSATLSSADGAKESFRQLLPKKGRTYEVALADKDRPLFADSLNINNPSCFVRTNFSAILDASADKSPFIINEVCTCSEFAASN